MTNSAAASGNSKMVTGLFKDSESVERAYAVISERDYGTGDINVVMSDDTRKRYFSDDRHSNTELGSKAAEGGELGGPTGGRIELASSSRSSSPALFWRYPAWD